ncbi:hypothetical protein BgiMline_026721 [Biomphalaria glabrata]|nr:hypothetical protein BgiMline_021175 [Biomphalaria glabrata]
MGLTSLMFFKSFNSWVSVGPLNVQMCFRQRFQRFTSFFSEMRTGTNLVSMICVACIITVCKECIGEVVSAKMTLNSETFKVLAKKEELENFLPSYHNCIATETSSMNEVYLKFMVTLEDHHKFTTYNIFNSADIQFDINPKFQCDLQKCVNPITLSMECSRIENIPCRLLIFEVMNELETTLKRAGSYLNCSSLSGCNCNATLFLNSGKDTPSHLYMLTKDAISQLYILTKDAPSVLYILTKDAPSQLYILTKDAPSQLYILKEDAPSQLYILTKDAPSQLYIMTKDAPSQLYIMTNDAPSQLYIMTNDATSQLYILTNDATSQLYILTNDATSQLYILTKDAQSS